MGVVVLAEEISNDPDVRLPERRLVGSSLRGVLAVDEALVVFPVSICMGQSHFNVLPCDVHNGVAQFAVEAVLQEVLQPMLAAKFLTVEVECEACVQVRVVPQQLLHVLSPKPVSFENLGIWLESGARAVAFGGGLHLGVVGQFPEDKSGAFHLTFPHTLHHEFRTQGIHRLGAHSIQAYGLFECPAVVLAARVDFRDAIDHLAQRDATSVISHTHFIVFDRHLNGASVPHGVLVNAVVNHFL